MRLRKRVQSKHILGGLKINWGLIEQHLWMDGPPMLSRADLENQLFLLRSGSTTSATYKGRDRERWGPWTQRRDSLWWGRTNKPPTLALSTSAWIIWGNTNHQSYLDWLAHVEGQQIQTGRFKTKKGYWIVKRSRQTCPPQPPMLLEGSYGNLPSDSRNPFGSSAVSAQIPLSNGERCEST